MTYSETQLSGTKEWQRQDILHANGKPVSSHLKESAHAYRMTQSAMERAFPYS